MPPIGVQPAPLRVTGAVFTEHHSKPDACLAVTPLAELMKTDHLRLSRMLRPSRSIERQHTCCCRYCGCGNEQRYQLRGLCRSPVLSAPPPSRQTSHTECRMHADETPMDASAPTCRLGTGIFVPIVPMRAGPLLIIKPSRIRGLPGTIRSIGPILR